MPWTGQVTWQGDRSSFATYEPIEPYATVQVHSYEVDNGHMYTLRRSGPELHQLDVSVSCWAAGVREPGKCCADDALVCS